MNLFDNILLLTDSYKVAHANQYKKGTETVYSYFESRGGKFPKTLFFGLQYYLKTYLQGQVVTEDKIQEAKSYFKLHFGNENLFNEQGWRHILKVHDGKLPVKIKAVPEGTVVDVSNVLMTIENTDPKCYWLTNYLETLLVQNWYPISVSTQSYYIKKMITEFLEKTGDPSLVSFKLHDFGFRGVSSVESAGLGGCAHLVNFMGTDTMVSLVVANKIYGHSLEQGNMAGFSIPASEHSTITSWGKDHEKDAFANMLEQYPEGLVACVSDSFDIYNACENLWGTDLKDKVMNRKGTLVVRPDCYSEDTEILTDKGWKLFRDLDKTERVGSFNSSGEISFVRPQKYVSEKYSGKMIRLYSDKNKIDLLVTPNHRMVRYDSRKKEYDIKSAEESAWYDYKNLPVSGLKQGSISNLSETDRLMIAFQADGRCRIEEGRDIGCLGGSYILEFQFAKKRKIERLKNICDRGGFRYKISKPTFRKFSKHNGKWNEQIAFYVYLDRKPNKHFEEWVKFFDKGYEWCQEFVDEVSYWDANRRANNRIKFDNTDISDATFVQTAAVLSGYRTTLSTYHDARSEKFSDVHTVHICRNKGFVGGQSVLKDTVDYDGMIYCVQVPSGMLVVRRKNNVVISGNSGDPQTVVVKVLDILGSKFGYTTNAKGYKVLDPHVRVIQGDGVNYESIKQMLIAMTDAKWSTDNVAWGMGGCLLQNLNRDTQSFAFKCSSVTIDGKEYDVFKKPVTDGGKNSKAGRLCLIKGDSGYRTVKSNGVSNNCLQQVFLNGDITKEFTLTEVRNNSNS